MLCCKRTLISYCGRLVPSTSLGLERNLQWNVGNEHQHQKLPETYNQLKFKTYNFQQMKFSNVSKSGQSRSFISWKIFSSSDVESIKDELIAEETMQDVLNVVKKRRSLLTSSLIVEAFLQLSKIAEECRKLQPSDFIENRDFVDLCILAENLVLKMSDDELVTLLHSLYLICKDECLSLSNVVQSECHNRLHLLNHNQLSYVAMWFYRRRQTRNPTVGMIAAFFQRDLYKIDDLELFARLTVSVMPVCTEEFSQKVLDRVLCLLEDADPLEVPVQPVRLILQTLVVLRNCHTKILKLCVSILLPKLLSLSLTDLASIHFCMSFLGFSHKEINSSIRNIFLQALPEVKEIQDIICTMEVLGPWLSPHVRKEIEEKLLTNSEEITAKYIQGICNGLRLMKHNLDSPLLRKVTKSIMDFSSEITIYDLVRISEYLKGSDLSPNDNIFKVLNKRLLEILDDAISPSRVKNVAYCLSQLPIESVDTAIIERLDSMWSSYHAGDIHQIKKILDVFSHKTALNGHVKNRVKMLIEKVSGYSIEDISSFKSIVYLNQHIDTLLSSRVDKDYLVAAMDHYSNCLVGLSPKMAVQSINRVTKTGYLQRDVLEKAAEVISENLECIGLNHIISTLIPYCVFNYVPSSVPTFIESCAGRILPFIDLISVDHVLELGYLLSLSGSFSEPLMRKIFSVAFLQKFDNHQLTVLPKKKALNIHKLFCINRSVVLQCPQYEIPWFHQEYRKEYSLTLDKQMHHAIHDVKYFLTELCGGPSYLRTNVLTPYHYNINFECLLDTDGRILPSADYGSILNQCKNMAIGTSHSTKWGVSVKQLPPGAQRVAIDYLFPNKFCLRSRHCKAKAVVKKHNLEILGYKVIQIPYYDWNSKELFEDEDKLSYLQQLLFSDCKPSLNCQAEPGWVQEHQQQYFNVEGLGGRNHLPSNANADVEVLKVLGNMDKWS